VIMQATEVTQLMQKLGHHDRGHQVGAAEGGALALGADHACGAAAHAQAIVAEMFQMFLGMVTERRNLSDDAMKLVSDGRVFIGRSALSLKLIVRDRRRVRGDRLARERARRDEIAACARS